MAEVEYVAQTGSNDVDDVSSSGSSTTTHNTRFLGPLGQSGDLFSHLLKMSIFFIICVNWLDYTKSPLSKVSIFLAETKIYLCFPDGFI